MVLQYLIEEELCGRVPNDKVYASNASLYARWLICLQLHWMQNIKFAQSATRKRREGISVTGIGTEIVRSDAVVCVL